MKKCLATLALAAPLTAASVHGLSYFDRDLLWEDAPMLASALAVGTVVLVGIRALLDYSSTPRATYRLPAEPATSLFLAQETVEPEPQTVRLPTNVPAQEQPQPERLAA